MNQKNIFRVGDPVSGEGMLGYLEVRQELEEWAFEAGSGGMSLTGMHRVGKTSLAEEVERKLAAHPEEKILCLCYDVAEVAPQEGYSWCESLLERIISKVHELLVDEGILEDPEQREEEEDGEAAPVSALERKFRRFFKTPPTDRDYRDRFKSVFQTLKKEGWRICLMLDEFDAVGDCDSLPVTDPVTGKVSMQDVYRFQEYDFELFRELVKSKYGVKLLLISRRRLFQIERKSEQNSTFNGVFRKICLRGFREETGDYRLFYNALQEHYGIELSEPERQRLHYYAGGCPYLLSLFAFKMAQKAIRGQEIPDCERIFEEETTTVLEYFDTVYSRIRQDVLADGVSIEEKLRAVVLGPNIGVTQEDVLMLIGMGYLREAEQDSYLCISPLFTQYLSHKPYSPEAWERILKVQEEVSRLIIREVEHERQYSDEEWLILMDYVYRKNGAQFNANKYRWDLKNDRKLCGEHLRMPDILTLKDCFKLIVLLWDERFGVYFDRPKDKGEWEKKFALCGKMRDPLAHGLGGQLPQGQVTLANDHCGEILDSLEKHVPEHEPQGLTAKVKEYIQRELEKKETARPE